MKNNKFLALILCIPFVCLLSWLAVLTYHSETGKTVTVSVMGYDPRDLLSGHYIRYQIDWARTDCDQFDKSICPRNEFCGQNRWKNACRFYIPEKKAKELDAFFRRRNDKYHFEVIYSYKKEHKPIPKELLINGLDWRSYVEKNKIDL
ncbi:MAG: GDYXXLXY domain-containing protein [Alphaproteobacteria bacterium]